MNVTQDWGNCTIFTSMFYWWTQWGDAFPSFVVLRVSSSMCVSEGNRIESVQNENIDFKTNNLLQQIMMDAHEKD